MSKSCKVIKRYGVNRIIDRHTVGRKDEVTLYMLLIKYFGHIKMCIYVMMTRYISFMQNKTTCMNQHVNLWSLKAKEMNVGFFFFGLHLFAIFFRELPLAIVPPLLRQHVQYTYNTKYI